LDEADNIFPKLLCLLFKYSPEKLVGIDEVDVEHYHRIRNKLYHDGTGLSVDEEYLIAYRGIAGVLLNNLFDISIKASASESDSLERLILNWKSIEHESKNKLEEAGISATYKWEEAFSLGLEEPGDIQLLTELRMARNRLVHSETIDKGDIKSWLEVSEKLLQKVRASKLIFSESIENNRLDTSHTTDELILFQMAVEAYKKKGTPKHFLDSQKLSNEQRADLYDRVIYSEKGHHPKKNPYKKNG